VKKPQWITIAAATILTIAIFVFARTVPEKNTTLETHSENDGHDHGPVTDVAYSTDTILNIAKKQLTPTQASRLSMLENSISRGDVKSQQIHVFHQLARFWRDSLRIFAPYAWYQAEGARLENSEKSLTFAAHLILRNLQEDQQSGAGIAKWKALQAKDLFERSLIVNPDNDSSKVGLGACYLFGNISDNPMEGIKLINEVLQKDSTHVYAHMTMVQGSLISGQFEKAINRLKTVHSLQPENMEAILLLAEIYERTEKKAEAIEWYKRCLLLIKEDQAELRAAIEQRIAELSK
jgi:tetratricopeptide (TPR) repeat protein